MRFGSSSSSSAAAAAGAAATGPRAALEGEHEEGWQCISCTMLNPKSAAACSVCYLERGDDVEALVASDEALARELDDDGSADGGGLRARPGVSKAALREAQELRRDGYFQREGLALKRGPRACRRRPPVYNMGGSGGSEEEDVSVVAVRGGREDDCDDDDAHFAAAAAADGDEGDDDGAERPRAKARKRPRPRAWDPQQQSESRRAAAAESPEEAAARKAARLDALVQKTSALLQDLGSAIAKLRRVAPTRGEAEAVARTSAAAAASSSSAAAGAASAADTAQEDGGTTVPVPACMRGGAQLRSYQVRARRTHYFHAVPARA
jgi:hypothetical protein